LFGRVEGQTGSQAWWYVTDRQGSVIGILTGDGQEMHKRLAYRGFSPLPYCVACAGGLDDRYEYTGREFDKVTVLQYNRARWYDPYSGRWLSEDPWGLAAGDTNLYRYAGNSPTNATDPSGNAAVQNGTWLDTLGGLMPQAMVDWLNGPGGDALEQGSKDVHDNYFGVTDPYIPLQKDLRTGLGDVEAYNFNRYVSAGWDATNFDREVFGNVQDGWLNDVDAGFAGWADSLTFGGSTWARGQLYGETATRNHEGGWFFAGQVLGLVHSLFLGYGAAGRVPQGGLWAYRLARGYTAAGTAWGLGNSSYKLAFDRENFGVADTLGFLPVVGYGARKASPLLRPALGKITSGAWSRIGPRLNPFNYTIHSGQDIAGSGLGGFSRISFGRSAKSIHGSSSKNPKLHHVYVIVDTSRGKLVKPGISGGSLNRWGASPRANEQIRSMNRRQPGRYKAVIVERDVSKTRALEIEQMIVDKHAARNNGIFPTSSYHQRPKPQVESREQFLDLYGFPHNRPQGGRY
jgi:RHS repeat-associated protein